MKRTIKKRVKRASKSYILRSAQRDPKFDWEEKAYEMLGHRL